MTHQPRARVTCLRSCVLTQRVKIWVSPELGSNQFCFPFVLHQIVSWCACARCCLGVSLLVPGGPWAGNKFIFPWTVDIITKQTDTCKDSQAKVQVLEKYDPLHWVILEDGYFHLKSNFTNTLQQCYTVRVHIIALIRFLLRCLGRLVLTPRKW